LRGIKFTVTSGTIDVGGSLYSTITMTSDSEPGDVLREVKDWLNYSSVAAYLSESERLQEEIFKDAR